MFPTPLTCCNWTQTSRSKSNPQPRGSQTAPQPWQGLTLACTQNHTHQPSRDRLHSIILWLAVLYHPHQKASFKEGLASFLNPSPLGLAPGRHLINISGLTEARSADPKLSEMNPLRLHTNLSQVSRCIHWGLLCCLPCMADGRQGACLGGPLPLLYNCSIASLCQWVGGLTHNVPFGSSTPPANQGDVK